MTSVTNEMHHAHAPVPARSPRSKRQHDPAQDYQGHSHKKLSDQESSRSKILTVALAAASSVGCIGLAAAVVMAVARTLG